MSPEDLFLTDAFGAGGDHILFADLIEEAVFGQHGQGGKAADHRRQHRQGDVPQVIEDLLIPGKGVEVR